MVDSCYLFIGCFQSCSDENALTIELPAPETGTYTIEYYFLERVITFQIEGTQDEPLDIPVGYFNESADAKIKIKDPDGDYLTVQQGATIYDTFIIRVNPSVHYVQEV